MFPPIQQLPLNNPIIKQQLNNFSQNYQRAFGNISPRQMVQNLLNSGQMTQAQFNQLRNIVNQITGQCL